jgi:hypothetical protein
MKWTNVIIFLLVAFVSVACDDEGTASEAPAADAGANFAIAVGERPRFDGCASSGEIENYKWTILSAPETMSEDTGKVIREREPECAFRLDAQMGVDEIGTWQIQLEVSDAAGNVDTDTVTVTVTE